MFINSSFEGDYSFTIEGWNQYYTSTKATITIGTLTIYADCGDGGSAVLTPT